MPLSAVSLVAMESDQLTRVLYRVILRTASRSLPTLMEKVA